VGQEKRDMSNYPQNSGELPAGFHVRDLPQSYTDEILRDCVRFSTALAVDDAFVGSGTFVSWDDKIGIMTAQHVTHPEKRSLRMDFGPASSQKLRISIEERPHLYEIEMKLLHRVVLGRDIFTEMGPDIAVIVLPTAPSTHIIRAKKSFVSLTHDTSRKAASAVPDTGYLVFFGHPGSEVEVVGPAGQFNQVDLLHGYSFMGGADKYFEDQGLDYIVAKTPEGIPEGGFGGCSGGGMWKVPLKIDRCTRKPTYEGTIFAGVSFWEHKEKGEVVAVRGHGPKTIYSNMLEKLQNIA